MNKITKEMAMERQQHCAQQKKIVDERARSIPCPDCGGTGTIKNPNAGTCDDPYMTCPRCNGSGKIG